MEWLEDNEAFMALLTEENLNNGRIYAELKLLRKGTYFTCCQRYDDGIYIDFRTLRFILRDVRCFQLLRMWRTDIVAYALLGNVANLATIGEMYFREKNARILDIFDQVSTQLFKRGHFVNYVYKQTAEMIGVLGSMGHGVRTVMERLRRDHKFPPCDPRRVYRLIQTWLDEHNAVVLLLCAARFQHGAKKRRLAYCPLNCDVLRHISSFLVTVPPLRMRQFLHFVHQNKRLNEFTEDMF